MSYLNSTFGGAVSAEFSIAGINRLALIEKAKITAVVGSTDMTSISGITVPSGTTFQEIFFTEESANYTQELTVSTTSKYITQSLNFRVDSTELSKAHSIILGRKYCALVKTNAGRWLIFGLTNGLSTTAATANGTEEDANLSFTMSGKNLGYAANVTMTDTALKPLINSI